MFFVNAQKINIVDNFDGALLCSKREELPLVDVVDTRRSFERVCSIGLSCLNTVSLLSDRVKYLFQGRQFLKPVKVWESWVYPSEDLPWAHAEESEGLILFVHGLKSTPLIWSGYLEQIKHSHVVAPYVPELGNCSLECAAEPLLRLVEDYIEKFPGKPVTLVGISNGGRIISYIESYLKFVQDLNVVSIAGVHCGTKLIDWLDEYKLLPLARLDPELVEEFRWKSAFAQELLKKWGEKQGVWQRHGVKVRHLFCAGLEDEKVFDLSSSLPILSEGDYRLYRGENHETVISACKRDVLTWLDQE